MKTLVLVAIPLLLLSEGCSMLHQVDGESPGEWIDGAKKNLVGLDAAVFTNRGHVFKGKIIQLTSDSLTVQKVDTSSVRAIPLSVIEFIRPSHDVGASVLSVLGGTTIGALGGAGTGLLYATWIQESGNSNGLAAAYGATVGACLGGLASILYTSITTMVDDYHLLRREPNVYPDSLRTITRDTLHLMR